MKKILPSTTMLGLFAALIFFLSLVSCNRNKELLIKRPNLAANVESIKNWWEALKMDRQSKSTEVQSRMPDGASIQTYWQDQFRNGLPKWAEANVYTINGETIYEIPFEFPDNIVLMNKKPDAVVQPYLSTYGSPGKSGKPSQSYLLVKPQATHDTTAEIMLAILDSKYMLEYDSMGVAYPFLHINNVYPTTSNTGTFTGSVKFFNLDGVQLLEQGYAEGALVDYLSYGHQPSVFNMSPVPQLSVMRAYQICTWTYVYQQNCGADAGCTDWQLIGVMFNGCETIVFPDSPPLMPPMGGSGDGSGPGGAFVIPPTILTQVPIPNAQLCGSYKWRPVGDALVCQIRNFGATFVKQNSTIPKQTVMLGLTCITIPKSYANFDLAEFVNYAYNETVKDILADLNAGGAPGSAILELKFKELFRAHLKAQSGLTVNGSSVTFHNGCVGDQIPVSEPKYCPPPQ